MINDEQMLNSICEIADMGRESLRQVLKKTDNSKLTGTLKAQISEYDREYNQTLEMLRQSDLKEKHPKARPIIKAESQVTVNLKTAFIRNKESQIAEMVIQGSSMGVVKITKELNDYNGSNPEVKRLAEKQLQTEQNNIEEMKSFL